MFDVHLPILSTLNPQLSTIFPLSPLSQLPPVKSLLPQFPTSMLVTRLERLGSWMFDVRHPILSTLNSQLSTSFTAEQSLSESPS